jgi:MoaA/NifB/PqqE/SkfB family radical SAM enzyme
MGFMKPQTVSFSKNASNVFFHILTACNLSCRHCYINPAQHGQATLSIETIEAWLAVLAKRVRAANLIFLGGEPTLHPELPAAIRAARRLGYRSVTVDTNGYLFHDILERVSPQEVDVFSFSIDGPTAAVNDPIRGAGCFAACTEGIRRAVAKNFGVSAIYTVSQINFSHLHRMPQLLADLGVPQFFIQVIGLRGKSAQEGARGLQLNRDTWLETVPAVARAAADLGISVIYPKVYLEDGQHFECAGNVADNYFIFPNGRVYRCPVCEDFSLHSLEFVDNSLVETEKINEADLFKLSIPEGCVMNKLVQPENLVYRSDGTPAYRVACCMLKEVVEPG